MDDVGFLEIVIAVVIGLVVWRLALWTTRLLSTPPPEVDPEDTEETKQGYRCTVCGAEVVMTVRNVSDDAPPRHCREDMVPTGQR